MLLISLTSTGTGYGDELVEVLLSRPLLLPRSGDCSLAAGNPGESWPAAAPHPPGTVYSETRGALCGYDTWLNLVKPKCSSPLMANDKTTCPAVNAGAMTGKDSNTFKLSITFQLTEDPIDGISSQ